MDETIVRAARTLASLPRLCILSHLARNEEHNPTALARQLKMRLNVVCTHLRVLSTAGLIQRRKSGTWCFYRAESPYSMQAFSGKLTDWIRHLLTSRLGGGENRGPREVRDSRLGREDTELHALLFECATAFTDLRRIQMLRYLSRRGTATVSALMTELSMSRDAVSRHTQKLVRRGYLTSQRGTGRCLTYQLAPSFRTPVHAQMLAIVCSTWEEQNRGPREVRDYPDIES